MDPRPIPAFYCCYLLRSTVRHTSLYVGSTPNPLRRLTQHNGLSKGGAAKTSRLTLRPWEMTCIVSGFPSNIAALQFEWAWQNTHLTRHIPQEQRITERQTSVRISPKSGRTRKRPARPRVSLTDKLSNLHLLLRVAYFSRWPLEVRFFCEDVYRVWQSWYDRVDVEIRPGIKILLDAKSPDQVEADLLPNAKSRTTRRTELIGKGGVTGVDASYTSLRDFLEKSTFLLDDDEHINCCVCKNGLKLTDDLIVVCSEGSCRSASHMECLSARFLQEEGSSKDLVPLGGSCPTCKARLEWSTLVKEMSLRLRGEKEMQKVLKKKRKDKAAPGVEVPSTDQESEDSEDENEDEDDGEDMLTAANVAKHGSGWREPPIDNDDLMSVTSADSSVSRFSQLGSPSKSRSKDPHLEVVIEDSDWENAEVLE